MKRGGKVCIAAFGTLIILAAIGATAFGDIIPLCYAIPTLVFMLILSIIGVVAFLTAYGDGLFNFLERAFEWLEQE